MSELMHSLTAYGHSWVAGSEASRPAARFVDAAARQLGCAPTNLGVGGTLSTDTADLLQRVPAPASRLYLLMTGLNDARLHGGTPAGLESYSEALRTILRSFHAANPAALTVAVEQPHLVDYSSYPPHSRGSDTAVDAYNQRLRAVAPRFPHVTLTAVSEWDPRTMLAADMVHPNEAGHAELACAVVRAVSEAASGESWPRRTRV